ncbi:hypothetical protein GJ496_001201 [Pomphorhynchus laevis]|nr:hypothetical protein GJ496_001201 [Pomphorhynchus laevis]
MERHLRSKHTDLVIKTLEYFKRIHENMQKVLKYDRNLDELTGFSMKKAVTTSLYSWLPGLRDYKLFHNAPPSQAKPADPSPPPLEEFFRDAEVEIASKPSRIEDKSLNALLLLGILFLYLTLLVGLPVMMISIGATSLNKCPMSVHLPRCLVLAGIVILLFNFIGIMSRFSNKSSIVSHIPAATGLALILIITILFIISSVLVYSNIKVVNRNNASHPKYCQSLCFDFSLVILSAVYACSALSCLVFCVGSVLAGFLR